MKIRTVRAVLTLVIPLISIGVAYAAEQTVPTKSLSLKNPAADGDPVKRRLTFKSKAPAGTVVGNPTAGGAKLRLKLTDGAEQCFDLPAAGWTAIGSYGYRYKDFDGPGAVTAALVKRSFNGDFLVKLRLSGRTGPLDVVPVAGNSGFDVNLTLDGGDEYCAGGATGTGKATDKFYKVKSVGAPASCGVPACSPSGAFVE
jgi:hypothetical protein